MNGHDFTLARTACTALSTGALYLPDHNLLCVSDLHLGKSDRIARRSGMMLPPYEVQETLDKLARDIAATSPKTVICLGDSFDDLAAAESLNHKARDQLTTMQAGRQWIWIEGNHDPGPIDMGGTHRVEIKVATLTFRHIASNATAEVSGHYHPKHGVPGSGRSRPAFLYDENRLILPAYGAYTGGLSAWSPALQKLFGHAPIAVMTGRKAIAVPVKETQPRPHFRGMSY